MVAGSLRSNILVSLAGALKWVLPGCQGHSLCLAVSAIKYDRFSQTRSFLLVVCLFLSEYGYIARIGLKFGAGYQCYASGMVPPLASSSQLLAFDTAPLAFQHLKLKVAMNGVQKKGFFKFLHHGAVPKNCADLCCTFQ